MAGKGISALVAAAVVLGVGPALADLAGPAELPPPGYKGQQYVDSRGCMFLRAGYGGQVEWVPRVTRDHKQLCVKPASGRDVAVAEAPAAAAAAKPSAPPAAKGTSFSPAPADTGSGQAAPAVTAAASASAAAPMSVPSAPSGKGTSFSPPAADTAPATTAPVASASGAAAGTFTVDGMTLGCPAATPVAQRFELHRGGSTVLCTRGDGTLTGADFPLLLAGGEGRPTGYAAHVAAGSAAPAAAGVRVRDAVPAVTAEAAIAAGAASAEGGAVAPPPGYKAAWDDDRLNPKRGEQTIAGELAMDRVWTRATPAELREDLSRPERRSVRVVVRRADGSEEMRDGVVVTDAATGRAVLTVADAGGAGAPSVWVSTKSSAAPDAGTPKKTAPAPAAKVAREAPPATSPTVAASAGPAAAASAPAVASSGARFLVQVGAFGVPSNAQGAAGRLGALGLPVTVGKAGGGKLQVVYAGPFVSESEARAALGSVRAAGFKDAILRR